MQGLACSSFTTTRCADYVLFLEEGLPLALLFLYLQALCMDQCPYNIVTCYMQELITCISRGEVRSGYMRLCAILVQVWELTSVSLQHRATLILQLCEFDLSHPRSRGRSGPWFLFSIVRVLWRCYRVVSIDRQQSRTSVTSTMPVLLSESKIVQFAVLFNWTLNRNLQLLVFMPVALVS